MCSDKSYGRFEGFLRLREGAKIQLLQGFLLGFMRGLCDFCWGSLDCLGPAVVPKCPLNSSTNSPLHVQGDPGELRQDSNAKLEGCVEIMTAKELYAFLGFRV